MSFYDPFNGDGQIVSRSPDKVVWMLETEDQQVFCTQTLVDPILDANKERFNDSLGQRWGDGQVVAEIPSGIYFDKLLPAKKAGDEAFLKRFLNDSENSAFRTFHGKI